MRLKERLKRLEAATIAKQGVRVLREPAEDAPVEVWEQYRQDLELANQECQLVVALRWFGTWENQKRQWQTLKDYG